MENREEKKWMSNNTCSNLKNDAPHLLPQKKTADGLLQYDSNLMKIKSLQDNFFLMKKNFKKAYRINNKVLYSTRNYIISCDIP